MFFSVITTDYLLLTLDKCSITCSELNFHLKWSLFASTVMDILYPTLKHAKAVLDGLGCWVSSILTVLN